LNAALEDNRRILELLEMAAQAFDFGQAHEADRLLQEAQAAAPGHPLVVGEVARRMLLSGNPASAYDLLKDVAKGGSTHLSILLTLASALRGINRPDEALATLERALVLEPRNIRALLQKASLLEFARQPRSAAAAYRMALQMIPPGVQAPPAMRPLVEHAQEAVTANNRALENFLGERLQKLRTRFAGESLGRAERCLDTVLQKQRIYRQLPTFMYFPQLPAIEFYERSQFPWLAAIEAATDDIRAELLSVLADGPTTLEPYVALRDGAPKDQWVELNHSRRWGVYFMWRAGVAEPEHIARCPRTVALLKDVPLWDVPGSGASVVFSILDAKTRIPPHTGVNNTRLTVHIPLVIPPGCNYRVGGEWRKWELGKAFVFDDTIEHEAWNDSDVPRAVLIFDVWNPLLSEAEREFVRSISSGVGEYYAGTPSDVVA
jgi:aspartyl/asparaginyl beta-hydroxylase (cupin superfamily)